jgi:ABC-type molybdate transport system permease subunit
VSTPSIGLLIVVIVPLILTIVIVGFVLFVRWSRQDRGVDDWRELK